MAITNKMFTLMKFIGNTAYAYGPANGANISPDNKAQLQESSDYENWATYAVNDDERHPYGDDTTDVIDSGNSVVGKSNSKYLKDENEYDYDGRLTNIFTSEYVEGLHYFVVSEDADYRYYAVSPFSLSDRVNLNSDNDWFGSGSFGQGGVLSTNISKLNFIKVDKSDNSQYVPDDYAFTPLIELRNFTTGVTLCEYARYNGYTLISRNDDRKILAETTYDSIRNSYFDNKVSQIGEYFIAINYDSYVKYDSELNQTYGYFADENIGNINVFGVHNDGINLNVYYRAYDIDTSQYIIAVSTTTDGDVWSSITYPEGLSFNTGKLLVADDQIYLYYDGYYYMTTDFIAFTQIMEEYMDMLTYANGLYIGMNPYDRTIKYSTDGITFSTSSFEIEDNYDIARIVESNGIFYIFMENLNDDNIYRLYKTVDGETFNLLADTSIDTNIITNGEYYGYYSRPLTVTADGVIFFNGRYDGTAWNNYSLLYTALDSTNTYMILNSKLVAIPNSIATTLPPYFYSIDLELESDIISEWQYPNFNLNDMIDGISPDDFSINIYINEMIYDGSNYIWMLMYTTDTESHSSNFGDLHVEIKYKSNLFDDEMLWNTVTIDSESDIFGERIRDALSSATPDGSHKSFNYNGKIYFVLINNIIVASKNLVDWFDLELYTQDDFVTTTPIRVADMVKSVNILQDNYLWLINNEFYLEPKEGDYADFKYISNKNSLLAGDPNLGTQSLSPRLYDGDGQYVNYYDYGGKRLLVQISTNDSNYTYTFIELENNITTEIANINFDVTDGPNNEFYNKKYFIRIGEDFIIVNLDTGEVHTINVPNPVPFTNGSYVQSTQFNHILEIFTFSIYDNNTSLIYPFTYNVANNTLVSEAPVTELNQYEYYNTVYNNVDNEILILYSEYDGLTDITTIKARLTSDGVNWTDTPVINGDDIVNYNYVVYNEYLNKYLLTVDLKTGVKIYTSSDTVNWVQLVEIVATITIDDFPLSIIENDTVYTLQPDDGIYIGHSMFGGGDQNMLLIVSTSAEYKNGYNNSRSLDIVQPFYTTNLIDFEIINDIYITGTLPVDAILFSENISGVSASITNREISTTIIGIADEQNNRSLVATFGGAG